MIKDAKEGTIKDGKVNVVKGKCSACGTGMFKILPKKK